MIDLLCINKNQKYMIIPILLIKIVGTIVLSAIIFYSGYCIGSSVSEKHFNDH